MNPETKARIEREAGEYTKTHSDPSKGSVQAADGDQILEEKDR